MAAHALVPDRERRAAPECLARTRCLGWGNYEVLTHIDIDASPQETWAVLTDFAAYPRWSFWNLVGMEGDFRSDGKVVAIFQVLGRKRLPHVLIEFEEGRQFAWTDPILGRALGMYDHHLFRVEALPDGRSRFVQNDRPHGGIALVLGRLMAAILRFYYAKFNRALKNEVERRKAAVKAPETA